MRKLITTKCNPKEYEQGKYEEWKNKGYFKSGDKTKTPFSIVIPPPNVTGKLHLGHAWDGTLQDIVVRRKRMQGFDVLWLPGMDHAGIATQAKVDAKLKESNISRYDIGREKFLDEAWKWTDEYKGHIREQWASLGLSLDYSKECFTLDNNINEAVNKVFIDLYNKGFIYKGERAINWDPVAKTALSNIEVIHKEEQGKMYHFKYMIEGTDEFLEVATTRPETLASDEAVAVHPKDDRYKDLVGKNVITPFTKKIIPVITDDYIDIEFGTGCMKVSAHATADIDILKNNNLPINECIGEDGILNEIALDAKGMDRLEARKYIADKLTNEGLIIKVNDHLMQVGHSERTDAVVEIMCMPQWFVKMEELAKNALDLQKSDDKVEFTPSRFNNTFINWMERIEDWCISRQLWWGHRIPAWYKGEEVKVQIESPGEGWTQDEDVLDTWFSSALWPFTTLGFPKSSEDFDRYFPNSLLVTGYDIIFFWVSRMIFQSLEFTDKKPFENVLIHGLVRDKDGRKMSKSLGNGIDPIEVKEKYGTDSLRYFLTTNSSPGQDLRFDYEKVESSMNYINKIWNISRYVMMNTEDITNEDSNNIDISKLNHFDKWILNRLNDVIEQSDKFYERYDFGEVARAIYNFTWNDFASWYLEISKISIKEGVLETKKVLVYVLRNIVKLLHPFMPFVTEEIYQHLPNDTESIMISSWPVVNNDFKFDVEKEVNTVFEIIKSVRNIRNQVNSPMSKEIDLYLSANNETIVKGLKEYESYIKEFTNTNNLVIDCNIKVEEETLSEVLTDISLFIPLSGLVDIKKEIERLETELKKLAGEIKRSDSMLSNERFISKAPESKVNEEKRKAAEYKEKHTKVEERIKSLKENN